MSEELSSVLDFLLFSSFFFLDEFFFKQDLPVGLSCSKEFWRCCSIVASLNFQNRSAVRTSCRSTSWAVRALFSITLLTFRLRSLNCSSHLACVVTARVYRSSSESIFDTRPLTRETSRALRASTFSQSISISPIYRPWASVKNSPRTCLASAIRDGIASPELLGSGGAAVPLPRGASASFCQRSTQLSKEKNVRIT